MWPACPAYPWNRKHAKILSSDPLTECRPLPTPRPAGPCAQPPGIYRAQEEAPASNSTCAASSPPPDVSL